LHTPRRLALYVRVSTEEQAEHGYSIDAQLETLRGFSKALQCVIVEEYVERGVSGKSMKGRFELQRLLDDAKLGHFDEVLVWKISRMARKQLDLLKIVEFLTQHNVAFRSVSENFETETPVGKFALQMLGAVGELERNTIVDNVKMGMKHRARQGQWNGGTVLGYRTKVLKDSGKRRDRQTELEIVPDEAQLVCKIFEMYASGKGLKAITNQLNREGYLTKKGNCFAVSSVSEILKNPIYVGNIRYNVRENWSEKRRKGTNKDPIIAKGVHEPILSQELWDRVQALYAKKREAVSPRVFQGSFPLTGILRCPQCGMGMVAHRLKDKLKDGTVVFRKYYVCGAFQNKGASVCKSNGIRAEVAEEAVLDRLRQAVVRPKVLRDVFDRITGRSSGAYKRLQAELKTVEKALEGVEAKKDKWYKLYEEDGIKRDMLLSRMSDLQAELDRLKYRQSELKAELGSQNVSTVPIAVVKTVLTQFHRLMEQSPPEQQKALLHMMVRRIEIRDRAIASVEICLDERLQSSFLNEGPSGSPEGPFDFKGTLPLTITL